MSLSDELAELGYRHRKAADVETTQCHEILDENGNVVGRFRAWECSIWLAGVKEGMKRCK